MTAIDMLVAALRERHPPTPDRLERIARRRHVIAESLLPSTVDAYYLKWAARIAGDFLDQLNDAELELRLAYDQVAFEEWDEFEDEDGEKHRRRRVGAEHLGWTVAEVARRKARREDPAPAHVRKEVW